MDKPRMLLISNNYAPEPTGIGKYNAEMVTWLTDRGYSFDVVTAYPYYPYWKIQEPYVNKSFWYKTEYTVTPEGDKSEINKIYRCPHYIPTDPKGSKRVLSDISFFISAFFRLLPILFRKKYDVVVVVAPAFQLGLLGWLYKSLKGAKFIYHIQDLQIDAAAESKMIKQQFLIRAMFNLERRILKKADYVSSISDAMIRKIQTKYDRPVLFFPNWVDTKYFHPVSDRIKARQEFGFHSSDKVILYSGAIGEKQGLQMVIHAAKTLEYRKDLKFVICGSGPYRNKLVELAQILGLTNVQFLPLQPKEKFNRFLNIADVHLVLQRSNFNDLLMPSKLTTILSVGGLTLATAEANTGLSHVISQNDIGLVIEPENQTLLSYAIINAVDNDHSQKRKNARTYAEEFLTIDKILARFYTECGAFPSNEPFGEKFIISNPAEVSAVEVSAN